MAVLSGDIERPGARRRRAIARSMGMLALATTAMLAWAFVWRPMKMMHRVGLVGLFPEEGRQCALAPQAKVRHCYVNWRSTTPSTKEQEYVSMTRATRQISEAVRVWITQDSATSSHLRDSIALALDRWGGERIPCPAPDMFHGTERSLAAWRFDEQDVRLLIQRWPGADGRTDLWSAQVYSFPVGLSGCEPRIHVRRLLTPGELEEHLWRWITESSD